MIERISEIAREAGQLALDQFGGDFERWEKRPGNPVCAVDLEVDALLKRRLQALDPDAGWLSEETVDDAARLGRSRLWVVDPIDGTRDYIRARTGWAVSIALVEAGRPLVGVLDAPARGEHWMAERGAGATLNGAMVRVSDRQQFAGARVPTDQLPKVDRDLVAVEKPNGIALRMAMVAGDRADLVATLRWGHEWDIAASTLIVEEAGGQVTDAFGSPILFNTPTAQAFGMVAATPAIHDAAVDRIRSRAEELYTH